MAAQESVHELWARAFMGLPCPKKIAGIRLAMGNTPYLKH